MSRQSPRSCRAILSDALAELEEREAVLCELGLRVEAEARETHAAMVVIGRLLQEDRVPLYPEPVAIVQQPTVPAVEVGRRSGDLKRAVIEFLREAGDLVPRERVQEHLGNSRGLAIVIGQALKAGELIELSGGLGIPSTLLEVEDG